jgi:Ca2+-binding EF-hand superfamily protein
MQAECPDGKISRHKFSVLYRKMFPTGKRGAFYQHLFRAFDTDNSESLDFNEFLVVGSQNDGYWQCYSKVDERN